MIVRFCATRCCASFWTLCTVLSSSALYTVSSALYTVSYVLLKEVPLQSWLFAALGRLVEMHDISAPCSLVRSYKK